MGDFACLIAAGKTSGPTDCFMVLIDHNTFPSSFPQIIFSLNVGLCEITHPMNCFQCLTALDLIEKDFNLQIVYEKK